MLDSNKEDNRTELREFEYEVDRETRYVKNNKRFILYHFAYSEEDLKQDLWMEADKALKDYDPVKSIRIYDGKEKKARRSTLVTSYLRKHVKNKEHMCNHKKRKCQPILSGLLMEASSNSMNVENDIFAWDLLDAIRARINDFEKSVLSFMLENFKVTEISRILKTKTIRVQLAMDFIRSITKELVPLT
jgi:DNA-directed RNA polymerase specialized sigma24 family protein